MVLDCGGGTVDITVHKLTCEPEEKFLCEELLPSSGGCQWGSKFVDIHFEQFLENLFGKDFYETYKKNAMARLDILKHFEMLKRKFNPGQDERSRLQLSYLGEELTSQKLGEFVKAFNAKAEEEAKKSGATPALLKQRGASSVDLPPALMTSFFMPLFDQIKEKVGELMGEAQNKGDPVNFIFMVGGFSESPFLKSVIKNSFEQGTSNMEEETKIDPVHVLVPRRP